ncbi:hypothetical protein ACWDOP_00275 [Nocardia sp. NPDC003693]
MVIPIPTAGGLLLGLLVVVLVAAGIAFAVSTADFSDGDHLVPATPGPCAPFCPVSVSAPITAGW